MSEELSALFSCFAIYIQHGCDIHNMVPVALAAPRAYSPSHFDGLTARAIIGDASGAVIVPEELGGIGAGGIGASP